MDALNLSYEEVTEKIPYRMLEVMYRDRPRICHGVKVVRNKTGRDKVAAFNAKYNKD